jgi:hypothetical protein
MWESLVKGVMHAYHNIMGFLQKGVKHVNVTLQDHLVSNVICLLDNALAETR